MTFNQKSFCTGPWYHIQMDSRGKYTPCRLADRELYDAQDLDLTFQNVSIMKYFNSRPMTELRTMLTSGEMPEGCKFCHKQELSGESSMRNRYLDRSKIRLGETFNTDITNSPEWPGIEWSMAHNGEANTFPVDLQIDLTHVCNQGCLMCMPHMSRNASDFRKLHKVAPIWFKDVTPRVPWSEDPILLERFIDEISNISNLWYINFIGGETLYSKAFYRIVDALIENGKSKDIILGFITNGSIFSDKVVKIFENFRGVHVGISVETMHPLNEYIRYPTPLDVTTDVLHKFVALRNERPENCYMELSVTPTALSIYHLDTLLRFSFDNDIAITCNALRNRPDMDINILPDDILAAIKEKLIKFSQEFNLQKVDTIHDTCNPNKKMDILSNIVFNYITLVSDIQRPENVDEMRNRFIQYLVGMEHVRNNSILDYLPEYKEFLDSLNYGALKCSLN